MTEKTDGLQSVQMQDKRIMYRLEIGHLIGQEDIMADSRAGQLSIMVTHMSLIIRKWL